MFPNTFYFICFSDLVQIERASAGNMKLTSSERASDPDQPDDFGYTQSKFTPQCLQEGGLLLGWQKLFCFFPF
jgi:hypothetical protein